ncbi:MAG: hypothetical protein ABIO05_07145 [Ferruginibacter sp.]
MKQKKLLLLPLLFLCGFLFAQNNAVLPDKAGTWVLDKTVSNVVFYHMVKVCKGENVVFLKFNNKNTSPVKISWAEVFSTQLETDRPGALGQKSLVIPSGVSSYSDCSGSSHKEFITLSTDVSPAYIAVISKFDFKNITVEKVK